MSVPILLAAVRGIRRGYLPIGDNALIEIRARDVLTGHHPWLGTWSSASISSGIDVNHPGPLIFDAMALPVKVFGAGPGIAVGVAALHIAVVWAIGWSAQRIGGTQMSMPVLAITAAFVWSIGSELLYDPWQPNVLMLPFVLLTVLVWGVLAGRHLMLPWAVLVASFCVQTHLGYIFLAPAVLAAGAGTVAFRWYASRRSGDHDARPAPARSLGLALIVGLLAWAQPIAEQLFGAGQGNLSRLATSGGGGDGGVRTGLGLGVRLVGAVIALPPWWGRTGFDDSIPATPFTDGPDGPTLVVPSLVGTGAAAFGLLVVAGALVAAWVLGRRRHDVVLTAGVAVVAVALVVAFATVVFTPMDVLGLSAHRIRWLWPIGVTVSMVLVVAVVRSAGRLRDRPAAVAAAAGVVAAAFAVAAVPVHAHEAGPVANRSDIARIQGLVDQLDVLHGRGPILFDASGLYFAEPFTAPVMAALQRHGVPFVLDEEGLVRQMGERRRFDGDAELRMYVRAGREALTVPPGAERVAFQPAPDPGFALAVFVEPLNPGSVPAEPERDG